MGSYKFRCTDVPEITELLDTNHLTPLLHRWQRRSPLAQHDLAAVAALPHTIRQFDKDAYLVREGERADHCIYLLKGLAYRQKLVRDGARQIVSIHIPGEFVDLQNCLLLEADHNVQSLSRSEAAIIPSKALVDLTTRHPAVARAMWLDTLIDSSIFREWVVNVGRRDARARIAHLLCELALRLKSSGLARGDAFDFPLTQEQLADCTGLTSVHTNRTLQSLRRDGLISLSAKSLTVLDWHGLCGVGEFNQRYLHHAV